MKEQPCEWAPVDRRMIYNRRCGLQAVHHDVDAQFSPPKRKGRAATIGSGHHWGLQDEDT